MVARIIHVIAFIGILLSVTASAQDTAVRIYGKILADGRPIDQRIEVRLERLDSSLAGLAYTEGSFEFTLFASPFDPKDRYFLVVQNPSYKALKFELDYGLFRAASSVQGASLYQYAGNVLLELESVDSKEKLTASKVVIIKKIPANIPEEAIKEYDQAIEDFNGGNSISALAHLEKAAALAPNYLDAISKLGAEYLKAGKYEKAEAMLNQARVLDPKDPGLLTNLGTLFVKQGEALVAAAGADSELNLDLEAEASNPGEAHFRKAVEVLEAASNLDPQSARANFYLGTALYHIGEYARAESYLLNALAAQKPIQDARLTLLNIYKQQKRYDAALLQIEAYLAANPDSPQRAQLEEFRAQIKNNLNGN
jgi:tetratricopeptide (TPR) repeat protein